MKKAMKYKLKLNYTENELRELKELRVHYFSPMNAIQDMLNVGTGNGPFENLWAKYLAMNGEDEFDFMADINNAVMGTAIFPEKKYYVQLIRNNDDSYLNRDLLSGFCMTSSCQPDEFFQTKFTEQEIKAIDPRYMAFAVPVSEVDE